jgi:hypothetical protein
LCWRARAHLRGGNWTDAAYGFGGPDVAEVVGSAHIVGAALRQFLNSLEWTHVAAERLASGHFSVLLEVEPHEGPCPPIPAADQDPADEPVPRWEVSAAVGNAGGVFDAAYGFGASQRDEAHLIRSAAAVGAELTCVLESLTRGDGEVMKYGTPRFFLQLVMKLPQQG